MKARYHYVVGQDSAVLMLEDASYGREVVCVFPSPSVEPWSMPEVAPMGCGDEDLWERVSCYEWVSEWVVMA